MAFRVRSVLAIAVATLIAVSSASADTSLPAHDLILPPFMVHGITLVNFDIMDVRAEAAVPVRVIGETQPNSIFDRKRHIGIAIGDDNGVIHTSLGLYWTVAEWKRFNFGVPALEFGLGRYPEYDRLTGRSFLKNKPTIIISLASIHYRVGYIPALGLNLYVNFEQVHDLRQKLMGSQIGLSFSRK
jgi:hypothetical protein